MKKEIRLRYCWIKQRRRDVLEFLEENFGIEKGATSRTQIEDGLGITGDEAGDLIQKFEQRFHVDMSSLNFTEYFYDEGAGSEADPLVLMLKLISLPFAILILPFSYSRFKEILFYDPFIGCCAKKKPITVGDFITSSFTHKFTLQKDVVIKLV